MSGEAAAFVQFALNQGVAIGMLVYLLFRLEKRLERIDRLMTLWAEHQGLVAKDPDPNPLLR